MTQVDKPLKRVDKVIGCIVLLLLGILIWSTVSMTNRMRSRDRVDTPEEEEKVERQIFQKAIEEEREIIKKKKEELMEQMKQDAGTVE
jgi:hypothetical protein